MKIKKVVKYLIGIFIVILIIIIGKYMYTKKDKENVNVEEIVVPVGTFNLIKKYDGDNNYTDLYRKIYDLTEYMPKLQEKLKTASQEKIEKFYDKNTEKINECIGISYKKDFVKFINYLNSKEDLTEFKEATIDEKSFNSDNKYLKFNMMLKYDTNTELNFKVYFKKSNNVTANNPIVKFEIVSN